MDISKNIAIIGAGNLGLSIANGLKNSGFLKNRSLTLTRRTLEDVKEWESDNIHITTDNAAAVKQSEIIILAVQPQQAGGILEEVHLDPSRHILISVMTAVSLSELASIVGQMPIIRAMPNTAVAVQESMTCMAHNGISAAQQKEVEEIFSCVGKTLWIDEELMQAATVVCASGIAFWMRFIRATTQGGVQLGFDAADAKEIAVQTCLGAARLLDVNQKHPEEEIDRVTTPMGCTIAGLNEMEHHGLSSALIKGLTTSFQRISDMKKN
jgi:pyrroline-5-carboxylate reductase